MKAAVLDIGGSAIKYGQMDERLNVERRGKIPTPMSGMDALFAALDQIWEEIGEGMEGLAMSMPGVIDSVRGFAHSGGAMQYLEDRYFAGELMDRFRVPVWIGNDGKCAGVAEVGYGAMQGVQTGIVIILGTGIGGCLILNGTVHAGGHFSAGEVSFLHTNRHKPYDQNEWWANVNGITGLLSMVQDCTKSAETLSGEEIFGRAEQGDPLILKALDQFTEVLAIELFNMQCMFDAERIAVGGGISAQPLLLQKLREQSARIYSDFRYPFPMPDIVPCQFRNDANLIGAYYQFCQWRENGK